MRRLRLRQLGKPPVVGRRALQRRTPPVALSTLHHLRPQTLHHVVVLPGVERRVAAHQASAPLLVRGRGRTVLGLWRCCCCGRCRCCRWRRNSDGGLVVRRGRGRRGTRRAAGRLGSCDLLRGLLLLLLLLLPPLRRGFGPRRPPRLRLRRLRQDARRVPHRPGLVRSVGAGLGERADNDAAAAAAACSSAGQLRRALEEEGVGRKVRERAADRLETRLPFVVRGCRRRAEGRRHHGQHAQRVVDGGEGGKGRGEERRRRRGGKATCGGRSGCRCWRCGRLLLRLRHRLHFLRSSNRRSRGRRYFLDAVELEPILGIVKLESFAAHYVFTGVCVCVCVCACLFPLVSSPSCSGGEERGRGGPEGGGCGLYFSLVYFVKESAMGWRDVFCIQKEGVGWGGVVGVRQTQHIDSGDYFPSLILLRGTKHARHAKTKKKEGFR